jgi:hypothetical protein
MTTMTLPCHDWTAHQRAITYFRGMPSEEKPPVFRTWKGWYALLIAVLAALIGLFHLLTQHFA